MGSESVVELFRPFRGYLMAASADDNDDLRARFEDLMRAPDFSSARANARLELHEAVCAERYSGILSALERAAITAAALHERLNVVSSRMWLAVTGVCAASVVGLAAVIFHLLTRGK
jgi:hypothetical protein